MTERALLQKDLFNSKTRSNVLRERLTFETLTLEKMLRKAQKTKHNKQITQVYQNHSQVLGSKTTQMKINAEPILNFKKQNLRKQKTSYKNFNQGKNQPIEIETRKKNMDEI